MVARRCPGVRLIYSAEEPNRQRAGTWALGEGQVRARPRRTWRDDGRTPVVRGTGLEAPQHAPRRRATGFAQPEPPKGFGVRLV